MNIQVTQPIAHLASAAVRITLDGQLLGVIGPGESVSYEDPSHDERFPYEIIASCGHLYATYHGHSDVNLQIHWSYRLPYMILQKTDRANQSF